MKFLLFIFGLGILCITNSYSQSIYGVYHGSLVTDKNLMYIEEKDGNTFIKIYFSEKESIQVSGVVSNGKLTFPLPQNEGEDLTVCAELSEDSSRLTIEFKVDGKSCNTIFERIASPRRDLVKTWFVEPKTASFDSRIIGKWINYLTTDSLGKEFNDNILNKKTYVTSFLENGVVLYDLQIIRDVFKEYGYKGSLDYTLIPKANWSISNTNRLTISIGGTDIVYLYDISSDSLKLIDDKMGSVLYHVRK